MGKEKRLEKHFHKHIEVLESAIDDQFQSYKYSHSKPEFIDSNFHDPKAIPNHVEVLAHLKLLKAFQVLKLKIIPSNNTDKEYSMKTWQVFITKSVRRFIIFVTALKLKFGNLGEDVSEMSLFKEAMYKDQTFLKTMETLIPPLDVIMVWHSFLLNPSSMYDIFIREEFLKFAFLPLPLHLLNKFIDNVTFEYNIPEYYQMNYINIIQSITNDAADLQYDTTRNFTIYEDLVEIYCPNCKVKLTGQFPLCNDSGMGFADSKFTIENTALKQDLNYCYHLELPVLNQDNLKMLQLYADVFRTGPIQGTFKYFSSIICAPRFYKRDSMQISELTKDDIRKEWERLKHLSYNEFVEQILKKTKHIRNKNRDEVYYKLYSQFNLVSLTVQNSLEIGEDLVGCILRQERFVEKMNNFNWLHSPFIIEGMNESLNRYKNYFELLTDFNHRMLVPTLDIDLIWHTHQLTMFRYFKDCKSSPCQTVIDHNDKVEENVLGDQFEVTAKLYKLKFQQDYSLCFCWYCVSGRVGKRDVLKSIFKKKKDESKLLDSPLVEDLESENITHVSGHNAIRIPSKKSKELSEKNRYPWTTDPQFNLYTSSSLFVIPPVNPIGYNGEHCAFLQDDSQCCNVQAACTVQNNFCLAIGTSQKYSNSASLCRATPIPAYGLITPGVGAGPAFTG
ncbi:unnamed protein product [Candida verbasci]|uniref:Uncharacterized protein n=1 Tax=Candida verbasci TaxID=1227364 RepID=A0A9W4TS54_9ASCO|nr:unnamed protein product [Candida verbasci]